jgi:hypothetical protein
LRPTETRNRFHSGHLILNITSLQTRERQGSAVLWNERIKSEHTLFAIASDKEDRKALAEIAHKAEVAHLSRCGLPKAISQSLAQYT